IALSIYSLRFTKKIFFGSFFFFVTIFLVLQLMPVGKAILAHRYAYIPCIGIFYLAGEGLNYLWNGKRKWLASILLGAFSVFFIIQTYSQCLVWKDSKTLWTSLIKKFPAVDWAYNNRSVIYLNEGNYDLALQD